MYSTVEAGSALGALATPDTLSHALTEVKTRRGWMIVDSRTRWAGLTADGRPMDGRWTWARFGRTPIGNGAAR